MRPDLSISLPRSPAPRPALCEAFLRWQCRVRQMMMREAQGRPDDAITPALTLKGEEAPMGHIITVLSKLPAYSVTPELAHMAKRTHDPAQRRDKALQFFSATYYQKAREFSDILTATFPPGSEGAQTIRRAEYCRLDFNAYAQYFGLYCRVWRLSSRNPLYEATWRHNLLFNPVLAPDAVILAFEPDWEQSRADPPAG